MRYVTSASKLWNSIGIIIHQCPT